MIVLHEHCVVARCAQEVFAYACEFANCEQWDSTAISSKKMRPGTTGVGTEYEVVCALPVGTITLHYRVLKWQPDHCVVLEGKCPFFTVTDTITITEQDADTRLDYEASFVFKPALALLESAIRPGMERMGAASVEGLRQALDDDFAAPTLSTASRIADRLVLPGIARFSKWGYHRGKKHWQPVSASMVDKHVLLTGATSGIGLAAARELAHMGASLTLVVRDQNRGRDVVRQLTEHTGNDDIRIEIADMAVMAQVQKLVQRLLAQDRPVDVLINNAGALFNPRQQTEEGLEKSFALLLLGPYLLTEGLLPLLRRSRDPRVVNVVSGGMYSQTLEVDKLQSEAGNYSGSVAYARAKRGLMTTTRQWAQQWRQEGICCNAMHPGWADTPGIEQALPLFYKLTRPFLRSPEQGADTIVWLAAASEANRLSGKLFLDREPHSPYLLKSTRESVGERNKLSHYLESMAQRFSGQNQGGDATVTQKTARSY